MQDKNFRRYIFRIDFTIFDWSIIYCQIKTGAFIQYKPQIFSCKTSIKNIDTNWFFSLPIVVIPVISPEVTVVEPTGTVIGRFFLIA